MKSEKKVRLAVYHRSGGVCEAGIRGVCRFQATEIHHVKSRARGGSDNARNLLHVCSPCHRAITDNRPGTDRFRTYRWQEEGQRERMAFGEEQALEPGEAMGGNDGGGDSDSQGQ